MAFTTKANITTTTEFISDLVAFAVANAGYADEGTATADGETMYRISKTVDTVKTYWYFHYMVDADAQVSFEQYRMRMMQVLPTDANKLDTTVGTLTPTNMGLFSKTPTFTGYSFFTDGDNIFATLEVQAGIYCHLSFGHIVKAAAFTGGAYLTANNFAGNTTWFDIESANNIRGSMIFSARRLVASTSYGASYIRYSTGSGDWKDYTAFNFLGAGTLFAASGVMPPTNQTTFIDMTASVLTWGIWQEMMEAASPSTTTLRAPLFPMYIARTVDWTTGDFILLGHVPNVTTVDVSLLQPQELVNTDWRVFPLSTKSTDTSVATPSGRWGVAYREIV